MDRVIALSFLFIFTLSAFVIGSASASSTVVQIDDNHGLDSDDSIEEFERTGSVEEDVSAPNLSIEINDTCEFDDCGVIFPSDLSNDYIHIDYEEDIERDIRIFIPSEYVGIINAERDDLSEETNASFRSSVTEEGLYLVMEVTVQEPGEYTYTIGKGESSFNSIIDDQRDRIESASGVEIATDEWQYIHADEIQDASHQIATDSDDIIVEYRDGSINTPVNDSTADDDDGRWVRTPTSESDRHPIYITQRGEDYYIITTEEDHPEIRFKDQPTHFDRISSSMSEVRDFIDDGIWDLF